MSQNIAAAPAAEVTGSLFFKELRTRTAASHEALEAHTYSQSITTPGITMDAYVRYLHIMQQVVVGIEGSLYPILADVVPDIEARRKDGWMQEDLFHLKASNNPFPAFSLAQQSPSVPFALGAFYVLEGSTLGGRVILKSLAPALNITAEQGARYFAGYDAATGPMWQQFLKSLARYAASAPDREEEIIAGAQSAFEDILNYFNSCQAHEVEGHRQS